MLAVVPVTLGALLAGCAKESAPPAPLPAWPVPPVAADTPENAARTLLNSLRAGVSAIARRDQATARAAEDRAVAMAASEVIATRQPRGAVPDRQVRTMVGLWGALIAHYAADFQVEAPRVARVSPSTAFVEFGVSGRTTTLRAECVLVGSEWRVAALEYVGARPASLPTSGPA